MLLALAPLALCLAPQDVLVVDAQGGGAFTDIPQAVSAADSGDVILVRSGDYTGFTATNLALSVQAHPSNTTAPRILGGVRIEDVPKGETFVLDGLEIEWDGSLLSIFSAVLILNSDGALRIQDCALSCQATEWFDFGVTGLLAFSAEEVAVTDSTIEGGGVLAFLGYAGGAQGLDGGAAVECVDANVSLYRTIAIGGVGGDLPVGGIGGSGGSAVGLFGGRLFLGQCFLQGGASGVTGDGIFPGLCVDGVAGLFVDGFQSEALALGTTIIGGEGGTYVNQGCTFGGMDGPQVTGELRVLKGMPRALEAPGTTLAGDPVTTTYSGQPGDLAARLVSLDTQWAWRPLFQGTLLVDINLPQLVQIQGMIPAGGSLQVNENFTLPAGLQAQTLHMQGLFLTGTGPVLANPRTLTVLDSGL